jgi:hypothetical protein
MRRYRVGLLRTGTTRRNATAAARDLKSLGSPWSKDN